MAGRSHAGPHVGPYAGVRPVAGLAISLALHALVFIGAFTHLGVAWDRPEPPAREPTVTVLYVRPPEPEESVPEPEAPPPKVEAPSLSPPPIVVPDTPSVVEPITPREPTSMAAPPAPTAAEWAFAST